MPVKQIVWSVHAENRCLRRLIDQAAVEQAIRNGHASRAINRGDADWRIEGLLADGRRFTVVYDHPCRGADTALVVSLWEQ